MRPLALLVAPLLLAACADTPPTSSAGPATPPATVAPTPTPVQPLAALVDFPNGTGPQSSGYDLTLVGTDGHVAAQTHAATRTFIGTGGSGGGAAAIDLPEVSAANGRFYYLDGDQSIRSLAATGGPSGVIATVPGGASAHTAFAVSPDASKIAVSVITYTGSRATVSSLYIEDLPGGNRHDITHTGSDFVWPVGWRGTAVVLASLPTAFSQQGLTLNPYFAARLQVVDPATSNRTALIGGPDFSSACEVTGLFVAAGTACYHLTSAQSGTSEIWLLDWSGTRTATVAVQRPYVAAALHPNDGSVAICCDAARMVLVALAHASPAASALEGSPDSWPCWIDGQHVLAGSVNDHQFQPAVLTVGSATVARVAAHGFCAAVLSGGGGGGLPM